MWHFYFLKELLLSFTFKIMLPVSQIWWFISVSFSCEFLKFLLKSSTWPMVIFFYNYIHFIELLLTQNLVKCFSQTNCSNIYFTILKTQNWPCNSFKYGSSWGFSSSSQRFPVLLLKFLHVIYDYFLLYNSWDILPASPSHQYAHCLSLQNKHKSQ